MVIDLPRYSIIVPAYNVAETLERCLSAVTQQDYPPEHYEVVVVDDGSTDDTALIAKRFPVRVVQLNPNQGKLISRISGARAATYENLIFVDARVKVPKDLIKKAAEIGYMPLMPAIFTESRGLGWFNRLLTLIRQRHYRPRPPLSPEEAAAREPYFITQENFKRAPKGTTTFVCNREMWLDCQPEEEGSRHLAEDIMILAMIVEQAPIMQTFDVAVTYLQREQPTAFIWHVFDRGIMFASYNTKPEGNLYRYWVAALLVGGITFIGLSLLAVLTDVIVTLLAAGLLGLVGLLGFSVYLAQQPLDVMAVMVTLPIAAGAFGTGILWGLGLRVVQLVRGEK